MLQLTQKLGSGEMTVQEFPIPIAGEGMILVKNHYSLISAGTEGSTVVAARKNLIGKAKERPQQVKQVIDVLRKQGPVQTYRAVKKKLDAYSPLGYSCAGEVIDIGKGVTEFRKGDLVACAGVGYANHAEVVSVPVNLSVKLHPDTELKLAAYNTLGAISLQGIRQADLRLGECCAVIGLGLLGQLACLMLRAAGIKVVGIDIDENAVRSAEKHAADLALTRNTVGIEDKIGEFTNNLGVDAVIIAAATDSLDPVNFAGAICRKKAKVIILGAVPTGFDRDPYYYRKELELLMSCSYGPGRYDPNYEEKGIDYPAQYVRWTQKRNMEAFQQLVYDKKIDLAYLTTHEFSLDDAKKAYDMIVDSSASYLGILLSYNTEKDHHHQKIVVGPAEAEAKIGIAFIGAGSYAQGNLLPNIPKKKGEIVLKGVLSNTGTTSKRVAERFGFEFCTSDENEILGNPEINTVFIATRHNTHADYVLKSLKKDKNVFVEKPLCLNMEELETITEALQTSSGKSLIVGFNRRFSPLATWVKERIPTGAMSIMYRINAGSIPADSWIQDPEIGGGRIIGETCHFIDFLTFMNGSLPVRLYAASIPDPNGLNDTVNINLEFRNGSIGVIAYYSNGSKELFKEYIEIYSSGTTAIIEDFKEARLYGGKKVQKKRLLNQDKGQKQMIEKFMDSLKKGSYAPIPFEEIYIISKASILTLESIQKHQSVDL